ncbi:DUF1177 domain-containing protein, partial [Sulfolobus sp. F3]
MMLKTLMEVIDILESKDPVDKIREKLKGRIDHY